MNYEIDLDPNDFGEQTDALFHLGESYPLAHGELDGVEWECRLVNCGEQRINVKGERIHPAEIDQYYDTDKKLWKAIDDGDVELINNSWWELEFFRVDESSNWYLHLFTDNGEVVDSPKDAIEYFKRLMADLDADKDFLRDFRVALKGETDM